MKRIRNKKGGILVLLLGLLCMLGLTGCSGSGSASFTVTPMGDGSYLVTVNDAQIDTSDPDQVLGMINQMQSGYTQPAQPVVNQYEQAGYGYGYEDSGYVSQYPYADMDGVYALASVLAANGASEADIARAVGFAYSLDGGSSGLYGLPGMNIVKKIWADNGVTPEKMYANYNELVSMLKSVGINADIGSFETGFGTVDEICHAILGNMGELPGIIQQGANTYGYDIPGVTGAGSGTIVPIPEDTGPAVITLEAENPTTI